MCPKEQGDKFHQLWRRNGWDISKSAYQGKVQLCFLTCVVDLIFCQRLNYREMSNLICQSQLLQQSLASLFPKAVVVNIFIKVVIN